MMTAFAQSSTDDVVDPAQLRRIEATHRGFLYQHLFAAGCLLLAGSAGVASVFVERDEDVELRLSSDTHLYCQIKTRERPLVQGELDAVLAHFERIRSAHMADAAGSPLEFWLILNQTPNAPSRARLTSSSWPADVHVTWPGGGTGRPACFPPPWSDLAAAVAWCSATANAIPAAKLSGDTLTWKLAALAQYASAGAPGRAGHRFDVGELPTLFEQVVVQMHRFPSRPMPYRELCSEPALNHPGRVRMIVALAGAGKTAWAAEASQHAAEEFTYVDLAELPAAAVAAAIVREIAARCIRTADVLSAVLAPGLNGIDSLRLLDTALGARELPVTVVLDNVHRLTPETVAAFIGATRSLRWVLLGQPCSDTAALASMLQVATESLGGLTLDSIAAEFRAHGIRIDAVLAQRIAGLTGGLPLFVRQAAALSQREYAGDCSALCAALEGRSHTLRTPQEHLLTRALARLSIIGRQAATILAMSDVVLSALESRALVADALSTSQAVSAAALRDLQNAGVVESRAGTDPAVSMHDSFRLAAGGLEHELPAGAVERALWKLKELIVASLAAKWDFGRQTFLMRLLPRTGDTQTLIDLATSSDEQFAEYGYIGLVRPILEAAAYDQKLTPSDRFWALDTVVFWDFQERNHAGVRKHLPELERLYQATDDEDNKKLAAICVKHLLWAGMSKDASAARAAFRRAESAFSDDPNLMRVMQYNLATAQFHAGDYRASLDAATALVGNYYQLLGLRPEDVLFANPDEIEPRLRKSSSGERDVREQLKRLADTLELRALSLDHLGRQDPFARLHAYKFYNMAMAPTSAVRVGQDVADEFVGRHDFAGALHFLDSAVLPVIERCHLLEYLVPVRSQRAVVLAYLGRGAEAKTELERLRPFAPKDASYAEELTRQEHLINDIIQKHVPARVQREFGAVQCVVPLAGPERPHRKVGRNDPCPCGSGQKFKRCCGL